jgi:hypothetical protein
MLKVYCGERRTIPEASSADVRWPGEKKNRNNNGHLSSHILELFRILDSKGYVEKSVPIPGIIVIIPSIETSR